MLQRSRSVCCAHQPFTVLTTFNMIDPNTQHGRQLHGYGLPETHLQRLHQDPHSSQLSSYGTFFGDARQPEGSPLPTGSLRRGDLTGKQTQTYHTQRNGVPATYNIQPAMSLHTLAKAYGYTGSLKSGSLGATSRELGSSSYAPLAGGGIFSYSNGKTFRATSGRQLGSLHFSSHARSSDVRPGLLWGVCHPLLLCCTSPHPALSLLPCPNHVIMTSLLH